MAYLKTEGESTIHKDIGMILSDCSFFPFDVTGVHAIDRVHIESAAYHSAAAEVKRFFFCSIKYKMSCVICLIGEISHRCSSKRLVAARGSFTFSLDQSRSATADALGQVLGMTLTESTNSPHMQASPPITYDMLL